MAGIDIGTSPTPIFEPRVPAPVFGHGKEPGEAGVVGESSEFEGVHGVAHSDGHGGVVGVNDGRGGPGVLGRADGVGVWGISHTWVGVYGETENTNGGAAVLGEHKAGGVGAMGTSEGGHGVLGRGKTGGSFDGAFEGVHAVSHHPSAAGVAGYNDHTGPGIYGKSTGGGAAGYFDGNVVVTGDVQLTGADLAEHFEVVDPIAAEPGTVMVLDGVDQVRVSDLAYDRKVVGIVSGASGYRPGVVLDHQAHVPGRQPLALVGKAFCKVDASFGPVEIGDLLTTSPTPGHAMKAIDPDRAFGAVLGKAMAPLSHGRGLMPILVTLQ